jgi:hypothetical protein
MRRSLPLVLVLSPACAGETTTSFVSDVTSESSSGSSSSGSTTGEPTTTGMIPTTTGGIDPMTSIGDPDTSTSTGDGSSSTSTGEATDTSSGTSTSTGETSSSSGGSSTGESSSSTGEPVPDCDDDAQNQDETDVDCGGGICGGCDLGGACLADADCTSGWCEGGVCSEPGCLVDADCDAFDQDCVEATCDVISKTCDQVPIAEGEACDDGDLCTTGEACDKGGCLGGKVVDCSGLDSSCGLGVCDPDTGSCAGQAFPNTEGDACDDGFACTPDDTCEAGLCGAGGPGYLFFEDFSAPVAGWELGELWQIEPAAASPMGVNGADPDDDHSPSDDGALAGTLVGELVPIGALANTCLTSPAIDASGEDTLRLSFWRHLHTDHFPFVTHTLQVFDGADWQQLEKGYANPGIGDDAWTFLSYDLGPYINDALRVRVCMAQMDGALAHGGWSLDDLTVGPYACTPEE